MNVDTFFSKLWDDYTQITPQAESINALFLRDETQVINDHVAFRTFSDCAINLAALSDVILSMGYTHQGDYDFSDKKLKACSFIHPDPTVPKIFVSELERHKLSEKAQAILAPYVDQISVDALTPDIFWSGRLWDMPRFDEYETLLEESEYAAWLLSIGVRVNHFTISVNHLSSTDSLQVVLDRVKEAGFSINQSGGEIKGTPESLLEQGSTLADRMEIMFAGDQAHVIPTCFYEFAKRHADENGEVYQGFIAANANKIFDSTHAR